MAYGVGNNYARGERLDPPEDHCPPEYDYDADLGRSVKVQRLDPELDACRDDERDAFDD